MRGLSYSHCTITSVVLWSHYPSTRCGLYHERYLAHLLVTLPSKRQTAFVISSTVFWSFVSFGVDCTTAMNPSQTLKLCVNKPSMRGLKPSSDQSLCGEKLPVKHFQGKLIVDFRANKAELAKLTEKVQDKKETLSELDAQEATLKRALTSKREKLSKLTMQHEIRVKDLKVTIEAMSRSVCQNSPNSKKKFN